MRLTRSSLAAFCAALAPLAFAGAAQAQQNFYAGKTVNIVVGFSSGGGYDQYARLVARHLGNHVPGNPNVIVQNMPGASSYKSVQYVQSAAPKDGTVINAFNPGLIVQSLTIPDRIKVDFRQFAWLGSVGNDLRVCYTWHTKNIKSFDQLLKQPQVIMGETGSGSASFVNQRMLQDIFGVKLKQVLGYPGSAEKRLAVERGELDGDCGSWTSIPADWLRDRKVDVLIRFQKEVSHGLPASVTYAGDLIAGDPGKRALLNLLNAPSDIGRPYVMAREVPADRLAVMRAAFDRTVKDPAFLADAEKQQLIIDPLNAQQVDAMLKEIYGTPNQVVAQAKEVSGD